MPLKVTAAEARALTKKTKQAVGLQMTIDGDLEEVVVKKTQRRLEAMHQALLFQHVRRMLARYPVLAWLFSTLNGVFMPSAIRARAIEAGMGRGILDLWFPFQRVEWREDGKIILPGLAMDLKVTTRPTKEQKEWADMLVSCGWRVYFPTSAIEAWRLLCSYVGIVGADHYAAELESQCETMELFAGAKKGKTV